MTKRTFRESSGLVMGIIMLFALNSHAQTDSKETYAKVFETAKEYTLATVEAMPEDKLGFRPVDGVRTFAEQVVHYTYNLKWLAENRLLEFKNPPGAWSPPDHKTMTKQNLIDLVSTSHEQFIEGIKVTSMENDRLLAIILSMAKHSYHHRGQTVVYLRLNEITPPKYQ